VRRSCNAPCLRPRRRPSGARTQPPVGPRARSPEKAARRAQELSSFLRVQTATEMVVDRSSQGDLLRISFNISFPSLSCEFATLDVSDALGTKRLNLTKTIRKLPIGQARPASGGDPAPDSGGRLDSGGVWSIEGVGRVWVVGQGWAEPRAVREGRAWRGGAARHAHRLAPARGRAAGAWIELAGRRGARVARPATARAAQDLSRAGYYQHEDISALDIRYDEWGAHNMTDAEYSAPITHEHFKETMARTDIVVVNFFAPWCHWCARGRAAIG